MASIDRKCPLPPLDHVRKEAFSFYSPQQRDEPRPTPWEDERPSFFDLGPAEEGGKTKLTINGSKWCRIPPPPHTWELAEDDPNFGRPESAPRKMTPCHIHTSFDHAGFHLHIDFVQFMSWGPLSGTEEYIFFVDDIQRSRGGRYVHPPAGFRRAWPPCVRFGRFAVVMRECIHAPLDQIDVLTFWSVEQSEAENSA
jgi:hypothetical protein